MPVLTYRGGGGPPVTILPPMFHVKTEIKFDKRNRTFSPGEIISGTFTVTTAPDHLPQINGIFVELEGHLYMKNPSKSTTLRRKLVGVQNYFYGNGGTRIGKLTERGHRFAITIPDDSPATFTNGKLGGIKYELRCVAHQNIGGVLHKFDSYDVIIIPGPTEILEENTNDDDNEKGPNVLTEKPIPTPMTYTASSGSIDMEISLYKNYYQPGEIIPFVLGVRNGGEKEVTTMEIQFQQVVNYHFYEISTQSEKILFEVLTGGPGVSSNSAETWSGELLIPIDAPFSRDVSATRPPISFQYCIRVILRLLGKDKRTSIISKEFGIRVGTPGISLGPSTKFLSVPGPSRGGQSAEELLGRRMSMVSLAPSLPDYETATGGNFSGAVGLPPSYSCLNLEEC